jgi:hypothetical protein
MRNYLRTSPASWRNHLRNHHLDSVAIFRAGFLSSVMRSVRIVWRMISDRCEWYNKRRPLHLSSDLSFDLWNWRTFGPSMVVDDWTLLEELTTYRDHLDELLARKGDYVLIKERQVIGIFADRQEAIEKAYNLFGGQPAVVKQIVARERIHALGGVIL